MSHSFSEQDNVADLRVHMAHSSLHVGGSERVVHRSKQVLVDLYLPQREQEMGAAECGI